MRKAVEYEKLYQSGTTLRELRPKGRLKLMGSNLYHVELKVKAQWTGQAQDVEAKRCEGCGEIVNPVQNDCTCYGDTKRGARERVEGPVKRTPTPEPPDDSLWPRYATLVGSPEQDPEDPGST